MDTIPPHLYPPSQQPPPPKKPSSAIALGVLSICYSSIMILASLTLVQEILAIRWEFLTFCILLLPILSLIVYPIGLSSGIGFINGTKRSLRLAEIFVVGSIIIFVLVLVRDLGGGTGFNIGSLIYNMIANLCYPLVLSGFLMKSKLKTYLSNQN